ncbi:hypothetical protein [Pasteuria penetrans]|uniref:hypothetical protein n=1 Tax=Pasteuria penetrans TaxID=86005 RepID=UPI000F9C31D2|nr:hypothetical protein [Pasteuria penetrans]
MNYEFKRRRRRGYGGNNIFNIFFPIVKVNDKRKRRIREPETSHMCGALGVTGFVGPTEPSGQSILGTTGSTMESVESLQTTDSGTFRLCSRCSGDVIFVNRTIPINTTDIVNGTAISLSPPCILLAPSQQYLVEAHMNAVSLESPFLSFAFQLDGNSLPQSIFSTMMGVAAISNSFIVNSGSGVNRLCAINNGSSPIGIVSAIITVVKIS